MLMTAVTDFIC